MIGGGGAGGCTITATSSLATIPTVGIVTFTTDAAAPTTAQIHFGLASTGPTLIAPVDLTAANYRTLLLGMKGSSMYVYRIVVVSAAGTCTSPDYTIMTGAVPSSVPKPTVMLVNAATHAKGFIVTSSGLSGSQAFILDSDGAPVWWATAPQSPSRAHMSWDGKEMYMLALNVQNTGGNVAKIGMDGTGAMNNLSGVSTSHHDFTAIPGGIATMLWNTSGMDAHCSVVERASNGTMTTVVADVNSIYSSASFHSNAIHYYPFDDSYTVGDRNPNLMVKITRKGALVWQLGGSDPKDQSEFFSGAGTWQVNHGHHLLANGNFLFFNNGAMSGGQSMMRELKLDTGTMTATSVMTYQASGISSNVLGDVQRLPNGNTLVTYSVTGNIHEVSPSGQLVWSLKTNNFGYSEWRETLYGPPPY